MYTEAFANTRQFWTIRGSIFPRISDQVNYWQAGYNAVMITDTAFYRNRNYHTADDTEEKLDYKRMAMVVEGVYAAVTELAR